MTQAILFAAYGLPGHLNPIISIALQFRDRNYKIFFVTSACARLTAQKKLPGVQLLTIQDGMEIQINEKSRDKTPFEDCIKSWELPLRKLVKKQKIDLIFADFACCGIFGIAQQFNIKLAINNPGPLQTYSLCCNFKNFQNAWTIAGFTIIPPRIINTIIQYIFPFFKRTGRLMQTSIVFINSFFGFHQAVVLPPNVKLTGALLNQSKFQSIEPDLKQWLDYVRHQNLDIIYVTFGSIVHLKQNFLEKLYYDLNQTGKAILWSLPQSQVQLPEVNQRFFVRKWLPQTAILKLSEVKIVLSHCGWNGLIECIYSQKPMLCCPAFGDQKYNSELVVKVGFGIILRPLKTPTNKRPMDNPTWTTNQFIQKVNQLINNKKYSQTSKRMKKLSIEAGGFQTVITTIENYLKNGNQHLIDKSTNRVRNSNLRDTLRFIVIIVIIGIFYHMFIR